METGKYLLDIGQYRFDLKSEKINSIARLVQLGIPTVPLPHVLLPSVFQFYCQNNKLPDQAQKEIKNLFTRLKRAGYTVAVRPSIFASLPGVEFVVANSLNLPTLIEVEKAIINGYEKIIKKYQSLKEIEFAYLIQGFYTANKAGLVFSNDGAGHVYIEAAFGESTNIFTRGRLTPDVYLVDRKTGKVVSKKISIKKFTLVPSSQGLKRVILKPEERVKPVFTDQELSKICQYALKMEKKYGPQEIECAALRNGEIIFQSSRDSHIGQQKLTIFANQNVPIFAQEVQGQALYLSQLRKNLNLKNKIVVTDNLDIDFITNLIYRFQPLAVVLTKGSLTAHAVTILREAKIPSVLALGFKLNQERPIKIKTSGEIEWQ